MRKKAGLERRSFLKRAAFGLIGGGYLSRGFTSPDKRRIESWNPSALITWTA
jgi:hypothetical protein